MSIWHLIIWAQAFVLYAFDCNIFYTLCLNYSVGPKQVLWAQRSLKSLNLQKKENKRRPDQLPVFCHYWQPHEMSLLAERWHFKLMSYVTNSVLYIFFIHTKRKFITLDTFDCVIFAYGLYCWYPYVTYEFIKRRNLMIFDQKLT